jgi:hypothetical protein
LLLLEVFILLNILLLQEVVAVALKGAVAVLVVY